MQSIEALAIQTYQKNIEYFSSEQVELSKLLNILNLGIENGDYIPLYDLEYLDGYFDIKELSSGYYLYSGNSEHISKDFSKIVDFKKANYSYEGIPIYRSSNLKDRTSDKAKGLEGILPIMDYYMDNTKEEDSMVLIQKFIFIGVALGIHIPIIQGITKARDVLIIEDDLELFRLSLFTTKYYELSKNNTLIFSIADDENIFLSKMTPFLENNFFDNRYIKYAHFPSHSKHKLKQIQHAILAQNFITFQYKIELQKFLRPLEYINNGYKVLNLSTHINNDLFYKKPTILITAGPSLQKNIEWLKENHERFIIIAVSATLNVLHKHNITPTIITHLDGYGASLKHYNNIPIKKFLKHTLVILGPFSHPLIKYMFNKEQVHYFEEDTEYFENFGSITTPCVGSFSLLLGLILNAKELYLLGLDLAVDQKTGATHADSHIFNKNKDMDTKDDVSQEMSLRDNLLRVKGNFIDIVYTNTLFNFSIQSLQNNILSVKRDDQVVYNLNDGAYIHATIPKRVADIDVKSYKKIDKLELYKSVKTILSDNSSKSLDKKDSVSLDKRLVYVEYINEKLLRYSKDVSKTSPDQFMADLLGIVSDIITTRNRETKNIVHVYYTFFKHVVPMIFDFFNTQGMKNKKYHIKRLNAMIEKEMMNIEGIYSKTLKDFLSGDKSSSKENEYKFMATLYDPIAKDKIKDMYKKDAIGFLAVEENLQDEDFMNYIKELYVRFPQVTFKAFYFNDEQKKMLESIFSYEMNRFQVTVPNNIYTIASEIEIYLFNNSFPLNNRDLFLLLRKYASSLGSVQVMANYKEHSLLDHNTKDHPCMLESGFYNFTQNDIDDAHDNLYSLLYKKILFELFHIDLNLEENLFDFYYYDCIEYLLKDEDFKRYQFDLHVLHFSYNEEH